MSLQLLEQKTAAKLKRLAEFQRQVSIWEKAHWNDSDLNVPEMEAVRMRDHIDADLQHLIPVASYMAADHKARDAIACAENPDTLRALTLYEHFGTLEEKGASALRKILDTVTHAVSFCEEDWRITPPRGFESWDHHMKTMDQPDAKLPGGVFLRAFVPQMDKAPRVELLAIPNLERAERQECPPFSHCGLRIAPGPHDDRPDIHLYQIASPHPLTVMNQACWVLDHLSQKGHPKLGNARLLDCRWFLHSSPSICNQGSFDQGELAELAARPPVLPRHISNRMMLLESVELWNILLPHAEALRQYDKGQKSRAAGLQRATTHQRS